MLQGLPGRLLVLLLVVVRLLVTALLLPSMVHLTVRHHSSTLPPERNTHSTVRARSLIRLSILYFFIVMGCKQPTLDSVILEKLVNV